MRTTCRKIFLGLAILGLSVFGSPVHGQAPAREQLEMLPPAESQPAQEQPENPAPESGGELGPIIELKRAPRYEPFRLTSDSQYVYNSNVPLLPSHRQEDELFAETLGASFAPRLIQNLATAIYANQQFIRYATLNNYDFDAQAAGLSLQRPVRDWCIVSGGFEASRYILREDHKEFLKDFDLSLGVRRGQYLHERVFLYYGYQFDWMPTSPSDLSRADNALYAGVNVALLQPLNLQLAYRLRGLAYYQDARFDFDHSVNASLLYRFNQYISTRVYVSYADNTSDKAGSDYRVVNAGGSLLLSLRY